VAICETYFQGCILFGRIGFFLMCRDILQVGLALLCEFQSLKTRYSFSICG